MNKVYAGVGARITPVKVQQQMASLAMMLGCQGWTLRSGGQQKGADQAFEDGCLAVRGKMEIFLPWDGFCNKKHDPDKGYFSTLDRIVIEKSKAFHSNPNRLNEIGERYMGRNLQIIMGDDLNAPVDMIICWTEGGKVKGGTGHDIRVAKHYGIPVFNLWDDTCLDDLETFLRFNY